MSASPLREVVATFHCDDVTRSEMLSCGHKKYTLTATDRPARRRRCHDCAIEAIANRQARGRQ